MSLLHSSPKDSIIYLVFSFFTKIIQSGIIFYSFPATTSLGLYRFNIVVTKSINRCRRMLYSIIMADWGKLWQECIWRRRWFPLFLLSTQVSFNHQHPCFIKCRHESSSSYKPSILKNYCLSPGGEFSKCFLWFKEHLMRRVLILSFWEPVHFQPAMS